LRLALDAQPLPLSPALSDSLDITSEIAEQMQAAEASSDQRVSSAASGLPVPAVTSSEQLLVRSKLDLSKSSSAGGNVILSANCVDICIKWSIILCSLLLEYLEMLLVSSVLTFCYVIFNFV